jgi:hypothetical protein
VQQEHTAGNQQGNWLGGADRRLRTQLADSEMARAQGGVDTMLMVVHYPLRKE